MRPAGVSIALLLATASLRADSIWWGSGDGRGLEAKGSITAVDLVGRQVTYTIAGRSVSRPFEQIKRLLPDAEPALSSAENDLAAGKLEPAVESYLKCLRSSPTDWAKRWAAVRLCDVGVRSGRVDGAVAGFIAIVGVAPASAGTYKPASINATSSLLPPAIAELKAAAASAKDVAVKQPLLSLALEWQQVSSDQAGASATLAEIAKLEAATTPDPTGSQTNPADARATLAGLKLSKAKAALAAGDATSAEAQINADRTLFVAPPQQAEALSVLAEAKLMRAGEDKVALRDAALAYMRVVAHFKDLATKPGVADALAKVAQIHEKLGDNPTAADLYSQILNEFPQSPQAESARVRLAALQPAR